MAESRERRTRKRHYEDEVPSVVHDDHEEGPKVDIRYVLMSYPTSSPFPPRVKQKGNAFDQIFIKVSNHEREPLVAAPEGNKECQWFIRRLKETIKDVGHFLISTSLPATCNLKNCRPLPSNVVCEVFLVTPSQPPTVLTLTGDPHDQDVVAYNKSVAKGLTYARYFTKVGFDILYGVVSKRDVYSAKSFTSRLSEVKETTSTYCIPSNLVMSHIKCTEIYKAVIMCSALTEQPEIKLDGSDSRCQYILAPEMYMKLMTKLKTPLSYVKQHALTDDEQYFINILDERLSRLGHRTNVGTESSKSSAADVSWTLRQDAAQQDADAQPTDLSDQIMPKNNSVNRNCSSVPLTDEETQKMSSGEARCHGWKNLTELTGLA